MMNRFERPSADREAVLQYLDSDYRIVRPGRFVRCAVTGQPIALEDLRYWSVERQEPYATLEISTERYLELQGN